MNRHRTLREDVVWALTVLAGFAIGAVVLGPHPSMLIGAAIGVTVVLVVRALRRRDRHRRGGRQGA